MNMVLQSIFSAEFVYSILRMATPLILAAMAALLTKKAGVMCIAFESIMLFAALGGVVGSAFMHSALLGVLSGIFCGVIVAFIFAYFVLILNANTVLTGLALNTLGSGGTVFALYVICGDKGTSTSLSSLTVPNVSIPLVEKIPLLGSIVSGHNIMTYAALLSVILVYIFINKTALGLRIRSIGENPQAAESVGIKVVRTRFIAIVLAGVLASMGGVYMSMGYLPFFTRDMVAGRGFMAIAAQNLGGGMVVPTMLSAILFGAAEALSNVMQSLRLPAETMQMLPYIVTITALFFVGGTHKGEGKRHKK